MGFFLKRQLIRLRLHCTRVWTYFIFKRYRQKCIDADFEGKKEFVADIDTVLLGLKNGPDYQPVRTAAALDRISKCWEA